MAMPAATQPLHYGPRRYRRRNEADQKTDQKTDAKGPWAKGRCDLIS